MIRPHVITGIKTSIKHVSTKSWRFSWGKISDKINLVNSGDKSSKPARISVIAPIITFLCQLLLNNLCWIIYLPPLFQSHHTLTSLYSGIILYPSHLVGLSDVRSRSRSDLDERLTIFLSLVLGHYLERR